MVSPSGILTVNQERELEKVNAFYLQKEAEVSVQNLTFPVDAIVVESCNMMLI